MEVVAANPTNGNVPPFHNHDVREWSRIDSLTGCLERARLETDHWTANTANSSHKYGKVVDSRARSGVDGNLQQEAKRQLEVYQSQIPGGRLQVIKTHTVSSSRWTSNSKSTSPVDLQDNLGFENLQLAINPLDLTSQKSKASVGRAASRRPPSRAPRLHNGIQDTAATNLYRVSRICHQLHDDAVKRTFGKIPVSERQNGDGVEIIELESDNESSKLQRTKSTSSDDLTILDTKSTKSSEDLEDLEQLQNWRRTSKIRRSLQFPKQNKTFTKPNDLPENVGSVRRIKEDLEKGRRLNTALRNNSVDLEALDQILQSISSDSENKSPKRNSFVTVESIQAVKDRLRRTSSPALDFSGVKDDIDDGIVTGDSSSNLKIDMAKNSKVRSYVYGMEKSLPKKEISGTGSLESRSKHLNGNSLQKNEDWYNRRKSYGFEKVAQQDDTISKSKVESSTDSGICRSSEIIVVPTTKNNDDNKWKQNRESWGKYKVGDDWKNWKDDDLEGTMITIPITSKKSPINARRKLFERELGDGTSYSIESWKNEEENKRHSIAVDESKYVTKNTDHPKNRRTSLAINAQDLEDDDLSAGRKKRVEFCKTEVHFAADSGKVNIVETDEKPPPTNNFRRRRRYSGLIPTDDFNTNGLPVFQFGDQIQNGGSDVETDDGDIHNAPLGVVTVNTNLTSDYFKELDEDYKENLDNSEAPKGILKNKPLKPRPYILGETPNFDNGFDNNYKYTKYNAYEDNSKYDCDDDKYNQNTSNGNYHETTPKYDDNEEDHIITPWGVKLRPVKDEAAPIWRSTVTVRNTFYNQPETNDSIERPKPSKPASRRPESFNEKLQDSYGIRIVSPPVDARRSSWSVADRVKQVEDLQYVENKGYSTKINFGNGEATVVETDKGVGQHPTWPRREDSANDMDSMPHVKPTQPEKMSSMERTKHHPSNQKVNQKTKQSPMVVRKAVPVRNIKDTDKLSSPALVFQKSRTDTTTANVSHHLSTKSSSLERSPRIKVKNQSPTRLRTKSPTKEVLRQPKKSEMAYFGVPVSPQVTRKAEKKEIKMSDKPDLLQFHKQEKHKEPMYENLNNIKNKHASKREFDASILEELTKAADQILQAVHGYTDDDHNKHSTDDEKLKKGFPREPLDTISETKSWKKTAQAGEAKTLSMAKLKATSSNSSLEGTRLNKQVEQKSRRKPVSESSSVKATTKARRLQRASSREALLQSHGSSSEDLAIEVPIRKPRLVRKTKTTQLTVSNGLDLKKTSSNRRKVEDTKEVKAKTEERVPAIGLPEIRHKTAVSTIRSTAEKAARAEKLKTDSRKRTSTANKTRESKGQTAVAKSEKSRTTAARDSSQQQKISTANIRKCSRYDGTKH